MKILFIGDVVGNPGRSAVLRMLPDLRIKHQADAVIVNCENTAGGKGVTPAIADALLKVGADVLTSGNHVWKYREIIPYMEQEPRLIRPANYPNAPGKGSYKLRLANGKSLGVIQVEGRVFMRSLSCPFASVENELENLGSVDATFLDIHAEATSEKLAMGWHFDGRLSAIVGTHTHVQTADEQILPQKTAYITDVGMTGPHDSVIGMERKVAIQRLLTQRPFGHKVAKENVRLCGVFIDIDDASGNATAIERVNIAVKKCA